MKNQFITFRSVTFAQRGERILKQAGIDCVLRRTPKAMTKQGCGYSLQLRERDAAEAIVLLQNAQLPMGKVYTMGIDGVAQEKVL